MSCGTPDSTRELGRRGEEEAARLLESKGCRILSRNWRHHRGELDLVVRDPAGVIAFVEVKSARGSGAGDPGEWITPAKRRQVAKVALAWMVRHEATRETVRFDAVLVRPGAPTEHVEDAWRPDFAGF